MRVILLMFLLTPFLGSAQTVSFEKITYTFFAQDSTLKTWHRTLRQPVTITIDSANKRITYPDLQLWITTTTRRNVITAAATTTADTILTLNTGRLTRALVTPYIRTSADGQAKAIHIEGGLGALYFPAAQHIVIQYPVWNKYIRTVEFSQ